MNTRIIGVLIFALGAGSGWMLKPDRPTAQLTPPPSSRYREQAVVPRPSGAADSQRLEGILSGLSKGLWPLRMEKDAADGSEIATDDFPGLLALLQQRAGLTGLSYEDREVFGKLLK